MTAHRLITLRHLLLRSLRWERRAGCSTGAQLLEQDLWGHWIATCRVVGRRGARHGHAI